MNKTKSKIGYISVNFTPETIKQLIEWSKTQIPYDQLFTMELDGKLEGGNVMNKAHLTLFFGLDDTRIDHQQVVEFLSTIRIEKLEIETIETFFTQQRGCKIVVLKIADPNNILNTIHNKFSEFPHFSEYQKFIFTPHITTAFVKDDFDTKIISLDGLPKLLIQNIEYRIKNN